MKFIGHLDTMRYFQKAVRRAGLPAAYSGGFSPHMIMSFAAPLGVGVTSQGEYFDLELTEELPTGEIERRLDEEMVEGFAVISARKVEEGKAGKAMSLVAAADYLVSFRDESALPENWKERLEEFLSQPSILVTKKTKKNEKEIDLRPLIYSWELRGNAVFLTLASASSNYTKPDMVLDTFLNYLGQEPEPYSYLIRRMEVYADLGHEACHRLVSLEELGECVE